MDNRDVSLIAFYLPQYHPITENDIWWGKGFTEWKNTINAKPLFKGHYQPHIPADLGFYDLRLPETRQAQADLAKEFGIHGFCYYHYWFEGKRLLERPFNEVLKSGEPNFPFCLVWANEHWTRNWHGIKGEKLQPQTYGGDKDDLEHIRWLIKAFKDNRYIRVKDKPLFLIYRGDQLPNPERTIELWRKEADRAGLPGIYLVSIETSFKPGWNPIPSGYDASLLFQPQFHKALPHKAPTTTWHVLSNLLLGKKPVSHYDYDQVWSILDSAEPVDYMRYYTVCPGWDNSARKGDNDPFILHNSTPQQYGKWLRKAIDRVKEEPSEHRLVFINAWNEWAEGNHLEPDLKHGVAYLEQTRDALLKND